MDQILLIDDDSAVRRLYSAILKKEGYHVREASSAEEGLEKLEASDIQIVLCDVSMPGMDGFSLRRRLLEDPRHQNLPFLFLTARGSQEDMLQGLSLDADDYLAKDANGPRVVAARVRAILRRRESMRRSLTEELARASTETSHLLLPESPPSIPGWTLAHLHRAHQGVPGGDFYDYIDLGPAGTLLVIADVMGKRWKAWMFAQAYMAYIRSALRGVVGEQRESCCDPAGLLSELNRRVHEDEKTGEVLCTLTLALLDRTTGSLQVASAAHPPALLLTGRGGVSWIESGSLFVGFRRETVYTSEEITLQPGDRALFYTDGVIETHDREGRFLGLEGLAQWASEQRGVPVENWPEALKRHLAELSHTEEPEDDLTIIALEREALEPQT